MSESLGTTVQLTGLMLAIVTLIVGLVAFLRRHLKKSLSFRIINFSPLLSVKEEARDKIKITYDGKEVENVTLFLLEFVNTGNVEIIPSDIIKPIRIGFEKEVKVLTSEVETKKQNLGISVTTEGNSVIIKPELLNPKDSFVIKTLLSKSFNSFSISDYRIVGIGEIKEIVPKLNAENMPLIIVLFCLASIFGGSVLYSSTQSPIALALFGIGFLFFLGIIGWMAISIISIVQRRYFKKKLESNP